VDAEVTQWAAFRRPWKNVSRQVCYRRKWEGAHVGLSGQVEDYLEGGRGTVFASKIWFEVPSGKCFPRRDQMGLPAVLHPRTEELQRNPVSIDTLEQVRCLWVRVRAHPVTVI